MHQKVYISLVLIVVFGFHEDGILSGIRAAESLGGKCPWTIDNSRYVTYEKEEIPERMPNGKNIDILAMLLSFIVSIYVIVYEVMNKM